MRGTKAISAPSLHSVRLGSALISRTERGAGLPLRPRAGLRHGRTAPQPCRIASSTVSRSENATGKVGEADAEARPRVTMNERDVAHVPLPSLPTGLSADRGNRAALHVPDRTRRRDTAGSDRLHLDLPYRPILWRVLGQHLIARRVHAWHFNPIGQNSAIDMRARGVG